MSSASGGSSLRDERAAAFAEALAVVHDDVRQCVLFENALKGKGPLKNVRRASRLRAKRSADSEASQTPPPTAPPPAPPSLPQTQDAETALAITECVLSRARRLRDAASSKRAQEAEKRRSPENVALFSRYTDHAALRMYEPFLHYVPRIVNAVTLAEAVPIEGSGVTLPLDLHFIASRCRNAFYAPRKFSAVQLAYSSPRARVLVFRELITDG